VRIPGFVLSPHGLLFYGVTVEEVGEGEEELERLLEDGVGGPSGVGAGESVDEGGVVLEGPSVDVVTGGAGLLELLIPNRLRSFPNDSPAACAFLTK
jgi:hypothetical protein